MDGFVYLWRDRKNCLYYVGCHWGSDEDDYVCSSNWMLRAFEHRPEDFKRRIIARVSGTRQDVLDEEYRWLSMIKESELKGIKYYNLHNHHYGHWTSDEEKRLSVGQKISKTLKERGLTQEEKDRLAEARRQSPNGGMKGKHHTEESNEKNRQSSLGQVAWNKGLKGVQTAWNKGIPATEEMAEHLRNQASAAGKKRWEQARINNWKMPDEIVKQIADKKSKEYVITNILTGEEFEIKNLKAWCKENNLDQGNMSAIARGKGKSCKGYKVRYK